MKNRLWKAIEGFGNKERSVLTVIADNAADAVDVVYTELKKNPSRAAYLNRWQKTGQRVRPANPGLKKSGFEIEINNAQDIIDSRDIIERIDELESDFQDGTRDDSEKDELIALKKLAKEGEDYSSDWKYGEALIRDTYFTDYAMELAEDIGAINSDSNRPNNCIDWDQAARDLQMDYLIIDYDGVDYWIRSC